MLSVTFDTNVYRRLESGRVSSPCQRIIQGIQEQKIKPYIAQAPLLLESLPKIRRAEFPSTRKPQLREVDFQREGNRFHFSTEISCGFENGPVQLPKALLNSTDFMFALGTKIICWPRLGQIVPEEYSPTSQPDIYELMSRSFEASLQFYDTFLPIDGILEKHRVGFYKFHGKLELIKAREGYKSSLPAWQQLMNPSLLNDDERKEIGSFVGEWADGDSRLCCTKQLKDVLPLSPDGFILRPL